MGCLNILDEIIDFIYKKLKISNIVNNFLGNKRERPKTKTENKDNKQIIRPRKKCKNNSHKNETKINKKDDTFRDINFYNKKNAILKHFRKVEIIYLYKLLTRIHSFTYEKGNGNKEDFQIDIKNDGTIQWPENSYLKMIWKNCNEVVINDVLLGALDVDEMKTFYIKFDNLDECMQGKYIAIFEVSINDTKIGEQIFIYFTVK